MTNDSHTQQLSEQIDKPTHISIPTIKGLKWPLWLKEVVEEYISTKGIENPIPIGEYLRTTTDLHVLLFILSDFYLTSSDLDIVLDNCSRRDDYSKLGHLYGVLIKHPNISTSALERMALHSDELVSIVALSHPRQSQQVLELYSKGLSPIHRQHVCKNPSTPDTILSKLEFDPDPGVSTASKMELERRKSIG